MLVLARQPSDPGRLIGCFEVQDTGSWRSAQDLSGRVIRVTAQGQRNFETEKHGCMWWYC